MTQPTLSPPPGNLGLPFLGETLDFLRDSEFGNKRRQQYGDIFKSRILGKPTIFVCSPEGNQFVLSNENKYFVVGWPPSTRALLGDLSVTLQTGGKHVKRRKMLREAFTPRSLDSYIPTMTAITNRYLTQWSQQDRLRWYPQLRNYTFDVAGKLFVGLDNAAETSLGHLFEAWVQGLFSIPLRLRWTRFGKALRAREQLLAELETYIRQRQQATESREDALGLLLQAEDEEGKKLSLAELKDQILVLLFAGHETLTSAVASFCLLVAQHPDVLTKIRAEQQQFSEPFTLESLKEMTYLEQVLQEVLRLVPPVGGAFREVLTDCEFDGYLFPKGWNVVYQIRQVHQKEDLYPEPERFDPERFSLEHPDNQAKTYGYVPFGGGLRECLGKEFARLEMKVFAALLSRHYGWELLPDQSLEMITVPTPYPRDGLQVRLYNAVSI
jgi:cytochrome P450